MIMTWCSTVCLYSLKYKTCSMCCIAERLLKTELNSIAPLQHPSPMHHSKKATFQLSVLYTFTVATSADYLQKFGSLPPTPTTPPALSCQRLKIWYFWFPYLALCIMGTELGVMYWCFTPGTLKTR